MSTLEVFEIAIGLGALSLLLLILLGVIAMLISESPGNWYDEGDIDD